MGRPRKYETPSGRTKAWKLAHPERTRELNRASVRRWKAANLDKVREYARLSMRNWRARHPDRERATAYAVDLAALREAQGNRCAICGAAPTKQRLAVHHDHVTGRIRGLLCRSCNIGLGHFRDDPSLLQRALAYLDAP